MGSVDIQRISSEKLRVKKKSSEITTSSSVAESIFGN